MGRGGQRWAQEHLGWCRETIRKRTHELCSGMTRLDAFRRRRRKPAEEQLPRLLDDIRSIADGQSQADPKFQTDRLFTRNSSAELRRQLIAVKGENDSHTRWNSPGGSRSVADGPGVPTLERVAA